MTSERRVVRHTIRIQDDHQAIPTGPVVGARLRRDYPDEVLALKLDLWIETEEHPGRRAGDIVAIIGTDRPVPAYSEHLATVVDDAEHDPPIAWHLYRVSAGDEELDKRALVAVAAASEARHRRVNGPCWDVPAGGPRLPGSDQPLIHCQLEAGHAGAHTYTDPATIGLGTWTWPDESSETIHGRPEPRLPDPGRGRET